MIESKSVGLFKLLSAPLNPIGAFDAETFKANFRSVIAENVDAKFIGVDLSGIDFVYSDAYNAFMQFHQELLKRNGTFAVLADKESLAKSLRKVGLERFIRIFRSADEMAAYMPLEQKTVSSEAPKIQTAEPKVLDKNPLVDETQSSKGPLVAVIVLLLIVAAVVSYLVL